MFVVFAWLRRLQILSSFSVLKERFCNAWYFMASWVARLEARDVPRGAMRNCPKRDCTKQNVQKRSECSSGFSNRGLERFLGRLRLPQMAPGESRVLREALQAPGLRSTFVRFLMAAQWGMAVATPNRRCLLSFHPALAMRVDNCSCNLHDFTTGAFLVFFFRIRRDNVQVCPSVGLHWLHLQTNRSMHLGWW